MYVCTCGRTFPGTLNGAWEAKVHAEGTGHAVATRAVAEAALHVAQGA